MKKSLLFCASLQLLFLFSFSQTVPTANELFEKIKAAVASARTLSYQTELTRYNSGIADSVAFYKGSVWLKTMPTDTIFETHFHVAQQGPTGNSDYYYDGINAIDIWHNNSYKESEKSVTVLEPQLMGNGANRVQMRVSVLPYFNELTSSKALGKWIVKDSVTTREDESKKHWIAEWPESSIKDNFFSTRKIYVDKTTNFITKMQRISTWNGTRMTEDLIVKNIVANKPGDAEFVTLRQSYPNYKTTYVSRVNNSKQEEKFSLTGQKAQDFTYPSFTGESVSLKAAKGKLLLLDFWETWCGYCYLAMPKLKDLLAKYKDQLDIVGIVTENKTGVQQVINAQKFPYATVYADKKLLDAYKVQGRPTYLLLDDSGTIAAHSIGSIDQIEHAIKTRLGNK